LLGYPAHANVGDSAIWLGERLWLSRHGCELVYECSPGSYNRKHVASFGEDVLLLLHGGGNLGDIWPHEQRFRERVLGDFSGRRVIQLPQTIYFRSPANLRRARRIMREHGAITLLCRDDESLKTAVELCDRAFLCPDTAFLLNEDLLGCCFPEPVENVAWLCRDDVEASHLTSTVQSAGEQPVDWLTDEPSPLQRSRLGLAWRLKHQRYGWQETRAALTGIDALLAERRVRRGCAQLARGRRVVTDRLHAHILCLLLGIPHVLVDNSYGKLSSFHKTWTSGFALVHWAETAEAAVQFAMSGRSRETWPDKTSIDAASPYAERRPQAIRSIEDAALRFAYHYVEYGAAETALAVAKTAGRALTTRLPRL
jgi:pyruvyl transferase EpsO